MLFWTDDCSIGKFCSIAPGVTVLGSSEHRTDWVTTYPFNKFEAFPEAAGIEGHPRSKGPTVIGNDVWIGSGAIVLSGVKVGDGAVIGARAVVSRDVPPYAIAAGNPARVIRYRFSCEIISRLLAIRWWDFPIEVISMLIPLLQSPYIDRFLEAAWLCRRDLEAQQGNGS